jgi:hypothetical protein
MSKPATEPLPMAGNMQADRAIHFRLSVPVRFITIRRVNGASPMTSKDDCVRKYAEYKTIYKAIPKRDEFLKFAGIHERQLIALFGRDAYSKLQRECEDEANKLDLERTPRETIMRRYGDLALKSGVLPNSSDWMQHQLKPQIDGLRKRPHFIPWSEFPQKFAEWVESERISGYGKVLDWIDKSVAKSNAKVEVKDLEFDGIVNVIRSWSPARRRNSEGEYKIELRSHLKSLGYEVNEEFGESNFDLLISKSYVIEIKKDPKLGDYDRLFGQLARHLQHQLRVVALIFDAPGEDNFSNFSSLVDSYLNKEKKTVEIIKK